MPTTTQPAAGTALPATSLTAGLIFARNEADTAASTTLVAGGITTDGTNLTYATDSDGRYYTRNGSGSGDFMGNVAANNVPAEKTMLVIAKYVGNGGNQMFFGCDNNPPRRLWWYVNSSGGMGALYFTSGDSILGGGGGSPANMNGTQQVAILRMRNDAGTWKSRFDVGGAAGTEGAITGGTPGAISGSLTRGWRGGGDTYATATKVYFSAIWNRALSDAEMDALRANPWSIFDTPVNGITGGVTLDDVLPGGSFSNAGPSGLSGDIVLDDIAPGGSLGLAPGVLTSAPFKNWSGALLASTTIPKVAVVRITDMVTVLTLTDQSTDGSGVLSISNVAIVPGVSYLLITCDAAGTAFGCEPYTAS